MEMKKRSGGKVFILLSWLMSTSFISFWRRGSDLQSTSALKSNFQRDAFGLWFGLIMMAMGSIFNEAYSLVQFIAQLSRTREETVEMLCEILYIPIHPSTFLSSLSEWITLPFRLLLFRQLLSHKQLVTYHYAVPYLIKFHLISHYHLCKMGPICISWVSKLPIAVSDPTH